MSPIALRVLCLTLGLVLASCSEPSTELRRSARVEGSVAPSGPARGNAYLFLFAPGEAPPEQRGEPRYVTAVPEVRLAAGDARFRFSEVGPDVYRLWGFLDANGDADLTVDVLAQPGAGDWVPESSVELNVQPGQVLAADLALPRRVLRPLPAFQVVEQGEGSVLTLTDSATAITSFSVKSEGFGLLRGEAPRFFVRLADSNGDGTPDDVNGDGVFDLWPQFFLRFVPRPGQTVPLDSQGRPAQVLVPLLPNPAPFLGGLQGDPSREIAADLLQLFVIPLAQAVTDEPGRGRVVTTLGAIPVGEYELWCVNDEGGSWFVPNDLGRRTVEPVSSQALRFRVVHADAADAGAGSR
ncbi:hypothetical protein JRI60_22120 [Archangium violaceum]|uniref:hypothetical protein n=1 Tax=Archangium violaceum TaxID=83451 RepID=UPI0019515F24|nr:hypothetical protein [Archangium violaceum]QRO01521.1 hypothetical protein JRI60_22120 [Archangium violaceum]